MGGIINPVLNKIGNNIFWKNTDYVSSIKIKFIKHYILFEKIERLLIEAYAINNFLLVFGRLRAFFLKLANSRATLEEYIDSERTVEIGDFAPVPYRKYYEIFSEFLFLKFGLFKVKPKRKVKKKKKSLFRIPMYWRKLKARLIKRRPAFDTLNDPVKYKLYNVPFFFPSESRIRKVSMIISGFKQNVLIVNIELLIFPIVITYNDRPFGMKYFDDRPYYQKKISKRKNEFGAMKSIHKLNIKSQLYKFYRESVKKAALLYFIKQPIINKYKYASVPNLEFKPNVVRLKYKKYFNRIKRSVKSEYPTRYEILTYDYYNNRNQFRIYKKDLKVVYKRFKRFIRRPYKLKRLYTEFMNFMIKKRFGYDNSIFLNKLRRFKLRIKWLAKLKKILFIYIINKFIIKTFTKGFRISGFEKIKVNLLTMDRVQNLSAQVSSEYILSKVNKGYGFEQIFNYTKKCLAYSKKNGKISGYKFRFAGRFSRRQRATYRWEREGRTGVNTKLEQIDYGQGITIGKYGLYTLRIWFNVKNLEKRRLIGRP